MIVRLIICAIYLSFSNHSTYARFEEKIRSRKGEDKHFMYKKYPHIYMYIMCVHVHARACVCVCVHTHTHICIHAYICTERACTDTHTHTHTQRQTHPYQYLSFRRLVHRKKIIYGWFFASTNSKQRANIDASWQSRGRNNVIIDNCEHLHEFRIKNTCKTFFYLICKTFLLIT